ncbi:hypothetical protein [Haloquadratum walsbyi]|jgi:hypothetical protein|uniref:DUF8101 domain-containing protein n=1 Tax=Haloquadratum walsbyi J07HQW2 TaxID=1238425 RepID=U1PQ86_9EURY|nr:hypothetical protein [Haloquadratum walsbyi]ERG94481.1 MAG: hypothetical protein J07HQW2_00915 [Haloquadratum walsbyi J07HQW2]
MAADVPADVEAVLTQLLTASHEAALTIAARTDTDDVYEDTDSISHTHYTSSIESETSPRVGEVRTIRSAIDTVETVSTNKLPAGSLQNRLQHGCERVRVAIESDATTDIQPFLAAAYLNSMLRQIEE